MRTENEMFAEILRLADEHPQVVAAYLNGSRTNPKVEKDKYRDYDIVFIVNDLTPFLENIDWLKPFGEIAAMQEPNRNDAAWGEKVNPKESNTWLLLFKDGNRIDLQIDTKAVAIERYLADRLTIVLLDKEKYLPPISMPSDESHWTKMPTQAQFLATCNEFWWCLNNVAKGLNRNQIPYVLKMYYEVVHPELFRVVEWHIGQDFGFKMTTGMFGKYFEQYLSKVNYERYLKTYPKADIESIWQAIEVACNLMSILSREIADKQGFIYNLEEEQSIRAYLKKLRQEGAAE